MNKEILNRVKTAGKYQKKAVHALFPEKVSGHLDVIEKEIKMMVMEIAADMAEKCKKNDVSEEAQENKNASGVRKVDIL